VNGLRYGFLGISDVSVTTAAVVVLAIAVALFATCYQLFRIGYNIKT
jgi:ABC-2 type transport system permease protein